MTDPLIPIGDGHTDLSEVDREDLNPTYIATRGELNDAEQSNIAKALLRRPPSTDDLLDEIYLRELHRAMFGEVWKWAGRYRGRETNIGIEPNRITTEVATLIGDVKAWIEHSTFSHDEIAIRFHHRLVAIHPFPNGNGRHGRVAADYVIISLGGEAFSWGARLTTDTGGLREMYRQALERADGGEIADLLTFART